MINFQANNLFFEKEISEENRIIIKKLLKY